MRNIPTVKVDADGHDPQDAVAKVVQVVTTTSEEVPVAIEPVIPSLGLGTLLSGAIFMRANPNSPAMKAIGGAVAQLGQARGAGEKKSQSDDAQDKARTNGGLVKTGTSGGDRAGKPFTPKDKAEVKAENAAANGGQTTCENCGQPTVPGQQSKSGVTPPGNETHVDHIVPKSQNGDGSKSNAQILCRDCNLKKSDKAPQ